MSDRSAQTGESWVGGRAGDASPDDDRIDRELISAAAAGDDEAMDRLLRRHESKVLRLVRLLGVRPDDREDVAQEVFVRVFRHLATFKQGRSFRGWLYRITVNAVHDHRQRLSRRAGREAGWSDHLDETPAATEAPGDRAEALERRRAFDDALGVLSERERAVFVLVEMEGLERREVARSLGITSITVRRHLSRARSSLRAILTENEKKP